MSTTPNDAARPVEFDWPEYQWQGMGCGLEDRGITDRYEACHYGFQEAIARCHEMIEHHMPLYTATDYDKLREEVERLQMLCYEISRDCNACANERNEQRVRAEAAEARATTAMNLTDQWRRRAHELRYNPAAMPFAAECIEECAKQLDAALNAQGENK